MTQAKAFSSGDGTPRMATGVTMPPVATWIPTCSFLSAPQVPLCPRSMKPSRYAERARYAGRACDGRWKAVTLVSGAAPRRTSDASTGSALSESGGEANSGRFLNQPAHVFTRPASGGRCELRRKGYAAYIAAHSPYKVGVYSSSGPTSRRPLRAHVAVVRRRRDQERSRGLRLDQRRQAGPPT